MSLNMFWFLPTHGDGHYLGTEEGSRPVDHGYLQQIAQAADRLGYTGVLIPTGRSCEDAWLVAASMIPVTQRLKFLVALRPSVTSPTVAARQAATLDRLSNGRALFNLVTGSDPQELAGDGVFLDHSERYEASAEFTQVWRRLLQRETVDFNGKHIHVRGAKLLFPAIQQPYPPLYFGGSSDVAQELAAEQVDLYLTWGEPPELVKEKIEQVRAKAAAHGRKIRFGIRLHVIVRETNDEAWQAAERLISHLDDETIAKAQAAFARTDSVGQQRMAALHNGKRDNLEISPNLWAGVGLVRGGAGTALVGDGPTVAARINEYAALGIDSFVLSGYPHLEEAYRVGELLFPLLDVAIPEIPQPQPLNPQGEAVALGTLFPIYINTWHGIRNIDRGLVEMARSYGLSGIPLFIHVILPGALPSIMVGVRFALGLMWLTLIVAETISANSGIGYLAMNAREFLQTDVVVVAIILYALLGKLADVRAQLLERLWLRWNPAYHLKEATV